jgi:Glucose-6-phosphate dehydrogenase, NAD binding domain
MRLPPHGASGERNSCQAVGLGDRQGDSNYERCESNNPIDQAGSRKENCPSDALVFFGATGDLAYKKIFPALQNMIWRQSLSAPVIGVAKAGWTLEQLRERAAGAS